MAPENRLARFGLLLASHRSASHSLFPSVLQLAEQDKLTPSAYRAFAVNLATRTMLTLPEIHASCIEAALDLNRLRTAYGVLTGAEEGGFGKPDEVHTKLMMEALNNHGRICFSMGPIDLKTLMAAIRLLHVSEQLIAAEDVFGRLGAGEKHRLASAGVIDLDEKHRLAQRLIRLIGKSGEISADDPTDAVLCRQYARSVLDNEGVLPETIEYCLAQMRVLTDTRPGYIQGVGFAHEGLADGMIFNVFRIAYAGRCKYANEEQFLSETYPFFRAHGDYINILHGHAVEDGVEAVHSQREFAKLEELDEEALANAWRGANDFADRNARVWDGIMSTLQAA